jgi:hypothetical protein
MHIVLKLDAILQMLPSSPSVNHVSLLILLSEWCNLLAFPRKKGKITKMDFFDKKGKLKVNRIELFDKKREIE